MANIIPSANLREALKDAFLEVLDADAGSLSKKFVDDAFSESGLRYNFDNEDGIITVFVYPGCKIFCIKTDVSYHMFAEPGAKAHYIFRLSMSMYHDYSHVDNYTASDVNFSGVYFPISALPSMVGFIKELAERIIIKKKSFDAQTQNAMDNKSVSRIVKAILKKNDIGDIVTKLSKDINRELIVIKGLTCHFNIVAAMNDENYREHTDGFIEIYRQLLPEYIVSDYNSILKYVSVCKCDSMDEYTYRGYGRLELVTKSYPENLYPVNEEGRIDYGNKFMPATLSKSHQLLDTFKELFPVLDRLGYNYGMAMGNINIFQSDTLDNVDMFIIQMGERCYLRIVPIANSTERKFGVQVLLKKDDFYLSSSRYIEELGSLNEMTDLIEIYCRYVSPQRLDRLSRALNREKAGIEQVLLNVEDQFCRNAEMAALRHLLPASYAIEDNSGEIFLFFDKTIVEHPKWNVVWLRLDQDNKKSVSKRISNLQWVASRVEMLKTYCRLSSILDYVEIKPI